MVPPQQKTPRSRRKQALPSFTQSPPAPHSSIAVLLDQGKEARQQHQPASAIHAFRAVLEQDPHNIQALCGLGFTHLELNNYEESLPYFEQALQRDPREGRTLYGAAVASQELQRYDEALSYIARLEALRTLESVANAHYLRGVVFYEQGFFAEAAAQLEQGLHQRKSQQDRKSVTRRHRYLLAQCYIELNQPAAAIPHLEWLLEGSWSRPVQDQLGRLYLEVGRLDNAQQAFEKIITHDPNDLRALTGLGETYLARYDYPAAIETFKKALQIDHANLRALDGLAEAYKHQGDLEQAAGYLEQIRQRYLMPEAQLQRRLHALSREKERRDAELLRVRNIAALNIMATGIAHELRQPLSVIRLAAQSACRDLAQGTIHSLQENLQDIDHNVEKIDQIIRLLRDISSHDGHDALTPVLLAEVIDRALLLFRTQLQTRGIELVTEHLEHQVQAHPLALEQVLINLISNARDALQHAPHKLIRIWSVVGPSRVCLYVKDSGEGMSADVRRQAFDPFYTTKKGKGTGLGLYIACNLIRKMNGQLAIKETSPGQGTTIELILPTYL